VTLPRPAPALSIVVVFYDMEREARRTLHSLSARYQQGVREEDYEVVAIDNGSPRRLGEDFVRQFGPNFRYRYLDGANASPAAAINLGVALARSDYLAVMIDGARILSPGVLRHGLALPAMFPRPCGLVSGWHLGPDFQPRSLERGYNRDREDSLLASIRWPEDGYRLFEISSPHDPVATWFDLVDESNCTFFHRDTLAAVGGYDERFASAAGGLVNYDVQARLQERPDVDTVVILGEGTFHQVHGGATSSTPQSRLASVVEAFQQEYLAIRGRQWVWPLPSRNPHFVGHLPAPAERFILPFALNVLPEIVDARNALRLLHEKAARQHQCGCSLNELVAERDRAIDGLHREIAARDSGIEASHRQVAQLDAEIARLRAAAAGLDPRNPFESSSGERAPEEKTHGLE